MIFKILLSFFITNIFIQQFKCDEIEDLTPDCAVDSVPECFEQLNYLWTCYKTVKAKGRNEFCNKIQIPLEKYPQELCNSAEFALNCTTNLIGFGCSKDSKQKSFFEQWQIPLKEIHAKLCRTPSKNSNLKVLMENHGCWVDFFKPNIFDRIMYSLGNTKDYFHLFTRNMDDPLCMFLIHIFDYEIDSINYGPDCQNATEVIGDLSRFFMENTICNMPSPNIDHTMTIINTQLPTVTTTQAKRKTKDKIANLPLKPNKIISYSVSYTEIKKPFNVLLIAALILKIIIAFNI